MIKRWIAGSAFLHIILLVWGSYQDKVGPVKYTDVDYFVFSDAARCLLSPLHPDCSPAQGPFSTGFIGDPYARDTYRYTPLLALLATPNSFLHPAFAKILFSIADLIVGYLLYTLLRYRGSTSTSASNYVGFVWLANPIIANISTRGSAESILGVIVVTLLSLAERKKRNWTAIVFGLAVHFKVYPIIYGSSLLAAMSAGGGKLRLEKVHMEFALISFGSFMTLNAIMYSIWGQPFLEHTFLYHIRRLDHRHNFSPYFYAFYLSSPSTSLWTSSIRNPLAAFIPQLGLSIGLGFVYGAKDLAFAMLVQTMAFVTFNKVCTSQYFLWYLWLLPPVLPRLAISRSAGIIMGSLWVLGQALWLSQAYRLEMLGKATYLNVWGAGVVFFGVNCWILAILVSSCGPVSGVQRRVDKAS